MDDKLICYDLTLTGTVSSGRLLEVLLYVISVDFIADEEGPAGGAWRAEGSGGWSFRLREARAGGGVSMFHLKVEVDTSHRLFRNTCEWYMHPSKFPDFLRSVLAEDGLEVRQS